MAYNLQMKKEKEVENQDNLDCKRIISFPSNLIQLSDVASS